MKLNMPNSHLQDFPSEHPDLISSTVATPNMPLGASAPRSSALSTRITTVLSASYADLEIRDALEALDARGIQNTQETRRQLRLDVQKELIQCNGEIIQDFGHVAEQLRRIGTAIASLNKCCADMRAQISAANQETSPMLEEATGLMVQKRQVESKQRLLTAFTTHFAITEAESVTLTSTAEPVDDEFFRVLKRVKKIHQDSQILLGSENQRLGLEILEQSSKQLNAAFQKLYRWVQKEFKTLDLENPQINSSIRRALRIMAGRPTLFQSCLNFFAEAREHTLSDAFYAALTGSSSDPDFKPTTKPIEFQAHDPLRYIGDMLAWAHSATVSEREALEVLFISEGDEVAKGIQAGLESEPWARSEDGSDVFDGRKALNDLVSRDLAGVMRLLRQRTEQVIQSHDDATLAYRIANLIGFYKATFAKVLGTETAVQEVLTTLEESALRQFRANMRDHVAAVQGELAVAPPDLGPPEFLVEALETLKALVKSYDTSMASIDDREDGFQPILAEALDPFLNGCENLYKRIEEPGNDIFAINCRLAAKMVLVPFKFTQERVAEFDDTIEEHSAKLVDYQHRYFLDTSGLNPLLTTLSSSAETGETVPTLTSLKAFQPENLIAVSQMLDDFLPSALMDAMENIKQLRSTKLAQEITEAAAERLCADFELVESKIMAADELRQLENGSEEETGPTLRELFPRTSAEIKVLLS